MSRSVPQPPSSVYADEGTAAHALCEIQARFLVLKELTRSQFSKAVVAWREEHQHAISDEDEMMAYSLKYVDLLRSKLAENPNSQLLLEQRLPTGVPSSWGTSDAVIVSPTHVEIVDIKYGKGIRVEAQGNPQLRLYGVGALIAYGELLGAPEFVRYTVWQPRLDHLDSEQMTSAELIAWRDSLIPIAELALGPDAPFGPSEDACRWCPASGQCPAQVEYATSLDFAVPPEALEPDDLAEILDKLDMIENWCAAVRAYALDLTYSKGQEIPGYKVVMSGGKRSVTDPDGAQEALKNLGYEEDQISARKIRGIGELEKLLGKQQFGQIMSPYVSKSAGSPSLVKDSDKRASIEPNSEAAKEFSVE